MVTLISLKDLFLQLLLLVGLLSLGTDVLWDSSVEHVAVLEDLVAVGIGDLLHLALPL